VVSKVSDQELAARLEERARQDPKLARDVDEMVRTVRLRHAQADRVSILAELESWATTGTTE
jgi:hypothetical protein